MKERGKKWIQPQQYLCSVIHLPKYAHSWTYYKKISSILYHSSFTIVSPLKPLHPTINCQLHCHCHWAVLCHFRCYSYSLPLSLSLSVSLSCSHWHCRYGCSYRSLTVIIIIIRRREEKGKTMSKRGNIKDLWLVFILPPYAQSSEPREARDMSIRILNVVTKGLSNDLFFLLCTKYCILNTYTHDNDRLLSIESCVLVLKFRVKEGMKGKREKWSRLETLNSRFAVQDSRWIINIFLMAL